MKKLSFLILLIAMLLPNLAYSQKQGYEPYKYVASVSNGERKSGSQTFYVRFNGNMVNIDRGFGIDSNYKYSGNQNGNSIYYRIINDPYYGNTEDRNQYILVSPDKSHINIVSTNYNLTEILEKTNSSVAGEMIY